MDKHKNNGKYYFQLHPHSAEKNILILVEEKKI
jgi:hypothetical protein